MNKPNICAVCTIYFVDVCETNHAVHHYAHTKNIFIRNNMYSPGYNISVLTLGVFCS